MDFDSAYRAFHKDILRTAHSQVLPGMDYDDICSEMTICLWRATNTWKPETNVPFGSYWWVLWQNRKRDIVRTEGRAKRPRAIPVSDIRTVVEDVFTPVQAPSPPEHSSNQEIAIWMMISAGESMKDIVTSLSVSKRTYYTAIHKWRTDSVRNELLS